MKILCRYSRMGASSRLRTMQYLPYLRDAGLSIQVEPLFSDDYLQRLYDKRSTAPAALRAYAGRMRHLFTVPGNDVLWIEKEALPWVPWLIERMALPRRSPIVTDYDDAIFHRYDMHRSPAVRAVLGRKIDKVMAASALVTAGNSYLAERARQAGARRVEIVPTVVDLNDYRLAEMRPAGSPLRIGWIGTPSTWVEYMVSMMPLLADVAMHEGGRILAVGAGKSAEPHPLLDVLPWSEDTEVARIQEMDIGVMPLSDTPWSRGKCGYKLIQYMACGLPVIASPVGVNAQIVEDGVNGFLADSEQEWRAALTRLAADRGLRQRLGLAGRRKVEEHFSIQAWGPRVAKLLSGVANAVSTRNAPTPGDPGRRPGDA